MNILEAITALTQRKRVKHYGTEVRLANGRLQIKSPGGWTGLPIDVSTMEGYSEFNEVVMCEIIEDHCSFMFKMPFTYGTTTEGGYCLAYRAPELPIFRGYIYEDGHIGAHLWCVKAREVYRAKQIILERPC